MARETVKIVIVGHIDHGKSTLIGRLLLDTNSLPKERIAEIKKISQELGKDTELAYLTDQLKEERERGITIDTTQIFFKTRKRNFVIIDAPGHVEFLKNMITGATQAEAAVLIVDVKEGIKEQTRRHAYIISMLGIDKIIAVFNKMDLVDYKEERFKELKNELLKFFDGLRVKPSYIIPISAKEGINITKISNKLKWYKGPSLLRAIDSLQVTREIEEKPLRMPVQDVYEIDGKKIIVGRISSGSLEKGQKVFFFPSLKEARINSIKVFGARKIKAQAGESIGLILDGGLFVKRGEVIADTVNPPKITSRIKGKVFWMSGKPLQINNTLILRCATQEVECIAEKIEKRINTSTFEIIEEGAKELKANEAGVVIFKTAKPIIAEKFSFVAELGRFILERDYNLQGAGIITEAIA